MTKADVKCNFSSTALVLYIRGRPALAGDLWESIDPDGCNWQLDSNGDEKTLWIQLEKAIPCADRQVNLISLSHSLAHFLNLSLIR